MLFLRGEAPPARGAGGIPTSPLCPPGPPIPPSNGRGIPPDPPCGVRGTSPCPSTDRVRIGHVIWFGPEPATNRVPGRVRTLHGTLTAARTATRFSCRNGSLPSLQGYTGAQTPGEGSAAPKATVALPGTDVYLAGRAPARLAVHCILATGGPGAAMRHAPFGRPRRPLGTFPRGESTSSARRRTKPPTARVQSRKSSPPRQKTLHPSPRQPFPPLNTSTTGVDFFACAAPVTNHSACPGEKNPRCTAASGVGWQNNPVTQQTYSVPPLRSDGFKDIIRTLVLFVKGGEQIF